MSRRGLPVSWRWGIGALLLFVGALAIATVGGLR